MKRPMKSAAALAVAISLLVLLATPTAASSGTASSGTLSIATTPATVIDFAAACSGVNVTATDTTTTPPPYTGTLSGTVSGAFTFGGVPYVMGGLFDGSYVATGTAPTHSVTGTLSIRVTVYDGCTLAGHCSLRGLQMSVPFAGTFTSGSLPNPVGTLVIGGTGTVTAAVCFSPFNTFLHKSVTLSNLVVTLT